MFTSTFEAASAVHTAFTRCCSGVLEEQAALAHLKFFDAKLEAFPALTKSSSWSAKPIEPKFSFTAGAGFCRGSSTSQSTPHKKVKGYRYFKSNKAHNKLQHSLNGNTTLRLDLLHDQIYPKLELSLQHLIPIGEPTFSKVLLLKHRPAPTTNEEELPKLAPRNDPRLVFKGSARKANPQRGSDGHQPAQFTPPPSKGKRSRTGRRIRLVDPQGTIRFRKVCKRSRPYPNSIIHKNSLVKVRVPPPRGMPGAPSGASKEYTPPKGGHNANDRSRTRAKGRQAYRRWRVECSKYTSMGADSPLTALPLSTKATLRRAAWFRKVMLWQEELTRQKKPKVNKNKSTPPLAYRTKLRVGALNVQGMAETLKLKSVIQIMQEHNLDVVMLSETRSTSYYSYTSEQHLVILSGNTRDRHAGVGAVIHPRLRPHLADVLQVSNRILHLTFNQKGGRVHVIGAYAPHSGHDYDIVREPFWSQLESHIEKVPQPEPVYVTGDFNVRFQAQHHKDQGVTGPFTYGKGRSYIDHSATSNRSICVRTMQYLNLLEVASYKTPSPVHHITYRDKAAPPTDWSQYVLDPLIMQQFYAKLEENMGHTSLEVSARVRSFLDLPQPLPPPLKSPCPNPILFQRLDHTFTRRQWLSSINSCRAKLHTGFPSDHYLLVTEVQVKLASRSSRTIPPPRLNTSGLTPEQKEAFNLQLANLLEEAGEPRAPSDHTAIFKVYTDGSGSRGKATKHTRAGWGWCSQQHQQWITACGPVVTSPANSGYVGASVGSNNTGEVSAIIEALLYAVEHEYTRVHVHTDSQWSINVITGKWRPKSNKTLVETAKTLVRKAGMTVHFHWVKGHAGHEGNEKADTLAEAGKEAEEPSGGRTLPYTVLTSGTGRTTGHTADQFVTAMKEAAKTTIPYHRRVPRTPWISDETLTALEESRRAEANCSDNWRTLRNRAKRLARKDRVNWVHRQLESDPGAVSSSVWNVVRRQRKGFVGKRTHLIRDGVPQPWTSTHKVFRDHLQDVQWSSPHISATLEDRRKSRPHLFPAQRDEGHFTLVDLQKVLSKLKQRKAPGPDEVSSELFAALDAQG